MKRIYAICLVITVFPPGCCPDNKPQGHAAGSQVALAAHSPPTALPEKPHAIGTSHTQGRGGEVR